MIPTIEEFKSAIEEMREVYPFKDNEARIKVGEDIRSGNQTIHVYTQDRQRDVSIELVKTVVAMLKEIDPRTGEVKK